MVAWVILHSNPGYGADTTASKAIYLSKASLEIKGFVVKIACMYSLTTAYLMLQNK